MAQDMIMWVVAAALIDAEGRVLVQQRPPGKAMAGLWEFPGGKIEAGETPEDVLARELHEELGIAVAAADLEPGTFVSASLGARHLVMLLYTCRRWRGNAEALEASAIDWCLPADMATLAMPPADGPLVEWLSSSSRSASGS